MAHAVGLDALASAEAILGDLDTGRAHMRAISHRGAACKNALATETISVAARPPTRAALATLPTQSLQDDLTAAWGERGRRTRCAATARSDFRRPAGVQGRRWRCNRSGAKLPDRREDDYHDLARTPRHAYVAFLPLAARPKYRRR